MERIYIFILRNDVWIVILATMGLFWYASEYVRARRHLKQAVFSLEREQGTQQRNNALMFILVLLGVLGLIVYVNYQIAPSLPASILNPVPTPIGLEAPLAPPTPLATLPPTSTPPIAPTITLAAQPGVPPPATNVEEGTGITETITVGNGTAVTISTISVPPTPIIGCNLQLTLTEPRNGAVISRPIEFFGTADTPDFGGFKLEANGPQTNGQWASLLGRTIEQPVQDGLLGNVNLTEWESGPYLIRLTAVDPNQNDTYQCVIQITLENE